MQPFEQEGMDAVRRAAPECMVLLRNDRCVLPLQSPKRIALYGSGARRGGTGSGDVNVRLTETEVRDIRALNSAFEDFVLVLNVGGVVDLAPVADVLLGTSYPSGKLTTTWAAVTDDPSTEGFGGRACTGGQRCHNAGQCARFAGDSCRRRQSDAYVSADACRFAKVGDASARTGVGPCAYEAIRDLNILPCICAAVFFVHSAGKRCKIKENLF